MVFFIRVSHINFNFNIIEGQQFITTQSQSQQNKLILLMTKKKVDFLFAPNY